MTAVDELMRFHLLRRPIESELPAASELVSALLAPYRDLPALRYDHPLVLFDPPSFESLSDVIDRALRSVAPRGPAGERIRQHVLRAETEIRRLLASGQRNTLGELWDTAMEQLDRSLRADLEQARAVLPVDGRVVDCDENVSAVVVTHVWSATVRATSRSTLRWIDELILGLSGILRADEARSAEGRSPARLRASLGGDDRVAFDFDAWSAILRSTATPTTISDARRRRIQSALGELEAQQFFTASADTYPYQFRSCVAAAATYRERMPAMIRLVKAMAIAELELQNGYREAEHDPYFDAFDELSPNDVALFPSSLVCLSDAELSADELAEVTRSLGSNAPFKVLVTVRDVLGEPESPTVDGRQLGRMAMGAGTAFVVQTASSHLRRMIDRIHDGLASARPALFSVFTGSREHVPSIAPYLVAAAAVQSRAVPLFVFDPDAGAEWADRLDLDANPEPEQAWPAGTVSFEDAEMQRRVEPTAFSVADFAALDRRYGEHFTTAPPDTWTDAMRPASEVVDDADEFVPYLLMTTADGVLHRVVVDRELMRTVRGYAETWRSLQELGRRWAQAPRVASDEPVMGDEPAVERTIAGDEPSAPDEQVTTSDGQDDQDDQDDQDESVPEGPYIETVRCTTCDECTALNPRMFVYDDNKQASIADLRAGTYRDMVEAAEACQVAIIHPGLPWDTSEPGLDELIARAAAFA